MADDTDKVSGEDAVIDEARQRLTRCQGWEATARRNWLSDFKFANADSYNGYQWPSALSLQRGLDDRPSLTLNKTGQHCLMIINDMRKNKPGIKVRATGGGATYDSARVLADVCRSIEYRSHASAMYDMGSVHMVMGGFGYLRLVTEYVDEESFDQEILIKGIRDPLTTLLDPEAKEPDKSDSKFGFIFEDVAKDEFDKKYPQYKDYGGQNALGDTQGWFTNDTIRMAEYYRVEEEEDTIYALSDGQILHRSMLKQGGQVIIKDLDAQAKAGQVKKRKVMKPTVEYYLIIGEKIAEEAIWPGRYVPIIPVLGPETIIDGIMDRKSHTRAMLDAQRMFNYNASAAVEYGALQTKTPWIGAAEAIEGYENDWKNANRQNKSLLAYNAFNEAGEAIPPPQRVQPPMSAPVALDGMKAAEMQMMMVSGQYQALMGAPSNERSGKAINERQQQGETATYHFIEGLAVAIKGIGRQLIDLIPKVYDTPERVMRIIAEDGSDYEMQISPGLQAASQKQMAADQKTVERVLFDPNVGKYEVEADIGPAYATKREEAFNAFTLILTQAPELAAIIGDILFKAGDFPMADEAAARLRRMVPPQALGEGPSAQEQQLMQELEQTKTLLAGAMQELADTHAKLQGREQKRDVDVYNALTKRLQALLTAKANAAKTQVEAQKDGVEGSPSIDPAEVRAIFADLMPEIMGTDLSQVIAANAPVHATDALAKQTSTQGGGFDNGLPNELQPPQSVPAMTPPQGGL